jgi:YfiH family protein
MEWRSADGVEWLEADLGGGARAAFSTRVGGGSEGDFTSLNLGLLSGDDRDVVLENRRRLVGALELDPERVLFGPLVHGSAIAEHSEPAGRSFAADPGDSLPVADGQVARADGLVPLVLVADCLPVALAGPGAVAMIHCGWRGLAAGILERAVEATGAENAAVGPGIGPCCYEVGEEVLDAFADHGVSGSDGGMLDLSEVARQQLGRSGVEAVEVAGICTSCEPGRFFSHRRDRGRTGRQAGLVWRPERGGRAWRA